MNYELLFDIITFYRDYSRRRYLTRSSFTLHVSLTLFLLLSDPLYAFRVSFLRKLAIWRVMVNAEEHFYSQT